jgi:hypothetical protein
MAQHGRPFTVQLIGTWAMSIVLAVGVAGCGGTAGAHRPTDGVSPSPSPTRCTPSVAPPATGSPGAVATEHPDAAVPICPQRDTGH